MLEQMLQAAAAGGLGQHQQQGPAYSRHPRTAAQPDWRQEQAPQPASPVRRPLHEPRQPALAASVSGAKRRQTATRPPSRWDYRPAWNEGRVRVDDLPAAAAAAPARGRQSSGLEAGSPRPASVAAPQPLQQAWQQPAPQAWQQPAAQAWQQPTAAPSATQQGWGQAVNSGGPPSLQQQSASAAPPAALPTLQQPQLPPGFVHMPAAGAAGQGSGSRVPVIHQYFSGPPGPPSTPATVASPPQAWQLQWLWGQQGPAAADPMTRPATGCAQQYQPQPALPQPQQTAPWMLPGQEQAAAAQQGWGQQYGGYGGAPAAQTHPVRYQQRPGTPGTGLQGYETAPAAAAPSSQAWPPPAAMSTSNTPRPRSAASKVGLGGGRLPPAWL